MNHYQILGFDAVTEKNQLQWATELMPQCQELRYGEELLFRWADGNGIEIWFPHYGDGVYSIEPHFVGMSGNHLQVQRLDTPDDNALVGRFYAWAAPDGEGGGEFPIYFNCPNLAAHRELSPDDEHVFQLCGFAHRIALFTDEAAYYQSQADQQTPFASKSFIPTGLFREPNEPMARVTGEIVSVRRMVNSQGGGAFYWLAVVTAADLEIDVVAHATMIEESPRRGGIVSADVFLSGASRRVIEEAPGHITGEWFDGYEFDDRDFGALGLFSLTFGGQEVIVREPILDPQSRDFEYGLLVWLEERGARVQSFAGTNQFYWRVWLEGSEEYSELAIVDRSAEGLAHQWLLRVEETKPLLAPILGHEFSACFTRDLDERGLRHQYKSTELLEESLISGMANQNECIKRWRDLWFLLFNREESLSVLPAEISSAIWSDLCDHFLVPGADVDVVVREVGVLDPSRRVIVLDSPHKSLLNQLVQAAPVHPQWRVMSAIQASILETSARAPETYWEKLD